MTTEELFIIASCGEKEKMEKTTNKNKLGQMKIQQMAFMLIAVTIFLVMAGMFILMIRFSSLQDSAELLEERNALLLVSKISDSPELGCGNAFGAAKSNCIDTDKVMALKNRLENYDGFWGIDGLEIRWVYPEHMGTGECSAENYPECGKITLLAPGEGIGKENFVSLCRKEQEQNSGLAYDKCELGRIIVTD